jgi:hypothetical protein
MKAFCAAKKGQVQGQVFIHRLRNNRQYVTAAKLLSYQNRKERVQKYREMKSNPSEVRIYHRKFDRQ